MKPRESSLEKSMRPEKTTILHFYLDAISLSFDKVMQISSTRFHHLRSLPVMPLLIQIIAHHTLPLSSEWTRNVLIFLSFKSLFVMGDPICQRQSCLCILYISNARVSRKLRFGCDHNLAKMPGAYIKLP